jgi:hypothetical protein
VTGNAPKKEMDKKAARNIMSLGMTALRIFGMQATSAEQGLTVPGSVNIAFKWDAADEMHIEYSIPLKLLGLSVADNKEMDIGWKVNGFQDAQNMQQGSHRGDGHHSRNGFTSGTGEQANSGSNMGFNNAPGRPQRRRSMAEMMKEQSFWTKYTMVSGKKGF